METTDMHPFVTTVRREIERLLHRPTLFFITIVGPLLSFLLIAAIFSSGVPRDLPVAVVDLDHTALSRQIARMTDATAIATIDRSFTDLNQARIAVEEGRVEAVLYIPEGTEKDIYRGKSSKLALYLNNANIVKGGMLNSGIRKALGTISAGIKLQLQMKNGLNQEQATSRIMPVQLRSLLLFNPYTSYSYYLTVGFMPVLLIVFVLLGTIYVIGDELYRGAGPHWIKAAGGNFEYALLGKLLPYTVIYFCFALLMNLILFQYLGLPLRGNYHVIVVSEILLIVSYQFFAVFMLALTSNMRLSLSLGSAYSMLAFTYSGLSFPAFGMSLGSQIVSSLFPYTYWLRILIGQSLRGEPASNTVAPMYALWAFIVFGALFIPMLKYMLLNKHRWGKI
jgi:ABC-2 type transport system permease protein